MEDTVVERVLQSIQEEEVVELVTQLADIPSPTGEEGPVALFILDWLKKNGIEAIGQEVEPGRLNAVGLLRGRDRGTHLMFNGHLDTSHPGTIEDLEALGTGIPGFHSRGFVEDGIAYGLGVHNCKGPVAIALIALKALKEGGATLAGDFSVAAVCGEIGRAPIGKYQGNAYHGHGYGTRHLLSSGLIPDLALVVEPSSHQMVWTLPGVLYMKVTAYGDSRYIPYVDRMALREEGLHCTTNTVRLLETIERWGMRYEQQNVYQSPGGAVTPRVNIGAIEGGNPDHPNWSMLTCSAYVDVRVPPSRELMDVKREFEDDLRSAGLETTIEVYRAQKGYEGWGNQRLVEAISSSYRRIFNAEVPKTYSPNASMWNDNNIFHQVGVPAVKFGTGPVSGIHLSHRGGHGEAVRVQEFVKTAQVYALIAMDISGQ